MKGEKIPHYVDSQTQFFFWEIDEALPFFLLMVLGVLTSMLGSCMLMAVGLTYFYRKYKQSALEGVLLHMGYWVGIFGLNKKFSNGLSRGYEQ